MIVTIAGCGALGSLLAARLIEAGVRVQALQRSGPQLAALQGSGITIQGDWPVATRVYPLEAVSNDASALRPSRLILVLVKSYHTEQIAPVARILADDGVVLTLQNGLGNAERLVRLFGETRVAAGVATYGAHRIEPGVIGWGGDGFIVLGPWNRGLDVSWVVDSLSGAGLNVSDVDDPRPQLWKKVAINAMVNTLTALTRMRNGELLDNSWALEMMRHLCEETAVAAGRAGIGLDADEIWAMNLENLQRTAANRTSMLQDVEAERRTEIDAICGEVLKHSQDEHEFPYTRSVHALVRAIDAHHHR